MTIKQKLVVEKLLANPSMSKRKAMMEVGYSENTATAPTKNLLSSKGFEELKEQYKSSLLAQGIDGTRLAKKMNEWLEAQKPFSSHTEPDKMVPDYQTQIKAGEMLREDIGLGENKSGINIFGEKVIAILGGASNVPNNKSDQ